MQTPETLFDTSRISAIGMFHNLNYPEIFKGFSGPVLHTGNWDSEISIEGKNVAVIGCGSSAVQLIPAIVDKVKKLVSYQRNPSWVIPKFNWKLSFVTKTILKIPPILWLLRVAWFWYQEFLHSCLERDTFLAPIGIQTLNFTILSWEVKCSFNFFITQELPSSTS